MVIDDLDDADTGRTALLSSSTAQAGVAGTTNEALGGTILVAVLDSTFEENDQEPCAVAVVAAESESSSSSSARALFVAGSAALIAALVY